MTFNRDETVTPKQLCVTITISSGPDNAGREVYLLQSNANGCLGPLDGGNPPAYVPAGVWPLNGGNGPLTFCQDLIPGATQFVLLIWQSGGGGTDASSTIPITLL